MTMTNFDEPWPIYADRADGEPWKDRELLFKLLDKMNTQAEVGDALGCDPSTVSYWKRKFEDEMDVTELREDLKCDYYSVCGNEVPGGNNRLCDLCSDLVRKGSRDGIETPNAQDAIERMEQLHDHYDGYVEAFEMQDFEEEESGPVCDDCEVEMVQVGELDAYLCTECGATA